jgi:integrase
LLCQGNQPVDLHGQSQFRITWQYTPIIEGFYATLLSNGIGVRAIRHTHATLHRALERAVEQGLLVRNPAHKATLPRIKHTEMQVWDETQIVNFLVAAKDSPNEALYHLAIVTGMRQGELLGLKWSDIQWTSGTLYIKRQVQQVAGQGWGFEEPKTQAGKRTIKVGETTLHMLRIQQENIRHNKDAMGKRWQDNDLIFPSSVGSPLHPSNLRLDFNRVQQNAGLPKIRFHDLRHTAASLMLNHGVPVIVASKRLGHSKPSVTLDIYGHLYQEMQGEAARIMDELVTPLKVEIPVRIVQNVNLGENDVHHNCTITAPLKSEPAQQQVHTATYGGQLGDYPHK